MRGARIVDVGSVAGLLAVSVGGKDAKIYIIPMSKELLTPTRVPQGGLSTQAMVQREVETLNDMKWIDDNVMWGTDLDNLLHPLDALLGRLGHGFRMRQPINACCTISVASGVERFPLKVWRKLIRKR